MLLSSGLLYKASEEGRKPSSHLLLPVPSRVSIAAWHCSQKRMQGDKSRLNLTPPIARISKQLPKDPQPRLSLIPRSSGPPEPPAGVSANCSPPHSKLYFPGSTDVAAIHCFQGRTKHSQKHKAKGLQAGPPLTEATCRLPLPPCPQSMRTYEHTRTLFQTTPTGVGSEQVTFSESLGSSLRKRSILLLLLR